MDTDDLRRQGVAAKIELAETQASFAAVREAILEKMLSARTDAEASALVWRLQAVEVVRGDLIAKAASLDVADHEERMSEYR